MDRLFGSYWYSAVFDTIVFGWSAWVCDGVVATAGCGERGVVQSRYEPSSGPGEWCLLRRVAMVVSARLEAGGPMTLSTAVLPPGDLFVRRRESVSCRAAGSPAVRQPNSRRCCRELTRTRLRACRRRKGCDRTVLLGTVRPWRRAAAPGPTTQGVPR